MKRDIGYPCINNTHKWTTCKTMRLVNLCAERVDACVNINLKNLKNMIEYNIKNGFMFTRIGSGVIPFASHEKFKDLDLDWKNTYKSKFEEIGDIIKNNNMRISFHPDQFVLINSIRQDVIDNSIKELEYHADMLNLMSLDNTAKLQIHVGGVYNNKERSIEKFISEYHKLSDKIKDRLVIENCDRLYSVEDCLKIHKSTGIPILFDNLHHECLNNKESMLEAIIKVYPTWKPEIDGYPMFDYSSQEPGARKGNHAKSIDINHFKEYLSILNTGVKDVSIMLEIKDKELSAFKALELQKCTSDI